MSQHTVGVEEEFLLVDADDGSPREDAASVVEVARARAGDQADLDGELRRAMLETGTRVCTGLDDVRADLVRLRRTLGAAAEDAGARLVASGTHPTARPGSIDVTPDARYEQLDLDYQAVARVQAVCGTHVHVSVADRDTAVAALDRVRPWVPLLLAVSANSPWWDGRDSGYASYRAQVWSRWPSSGPTGPFGDAAGFDAVVDELVATGSVLDRAMVYFDVRPSDRYDTLEFRCADVCLDVDDAVLLAALARGLTSTAVAAAVRGEPPPDDRVELLRGTTWRASRSGVLGQLVHPVDRRPVPAAEALDALVGHVRDALDDNGDTDLVQDGVERVLLGGGGAARQRAAGSAASALELLMRGSVPGGA